MLSDLPISAATQVTMFLLALLSDLDVLDEAMAGT